MATTATPASTSSSRRGSTGAASGRKGSGRWLATSSTGGATTGWRWDRPLLTPGATPRGLQFYEKVGFKPVGVMRLYERGKDGTYHDGLLMDLLAGELT